MGYLREDAAIAIERCGKTFTWR